MTHEQKLALLCQWEASYLELDLQMDRLSAVVGSMVHSPFGEAVWGAWDNYTRALAGSSATALTAPLPEGRGFPLHRTLPHRT